MIRSFLHFKKAKSFDKYILFIFFLLNAVCKQKPYFWDLKNKKIKVNISLLKVIFSLLCFFIFFKNVVHKKKKKIFVVNLFRDVFQINNSFLSSFIVYKKLRCSSLNVTILNKYD